MEDHQKTKEQLLEELFHLRQEVDRLRMDSSARLKAEEALDFEKRRFQTLCEQAPFGMILVNSDLSFDYVNPKFTELLGYSLEDVPTGSIWFRYAYPDEEYRREVVSTWIEDLKHAAPVQVRPRNFTVRCKDGSDKTICFRAVQLQTGQSVLTCEDITGRIRSEGALEQSEDLYRTLVEESFDGIYLQQGHTIAFANSRVCEMLGYGKEELEGMDYWLIYHPDYRALIRERSLARMRGETVPAQYEVKFLRKEGSVFDGEINAQAIQVRGEPGVQVWVRDITERKRAEEALRRSEKLLTNILSASPIGISYMEGGRIKWANQAMARLFGHEHQDDWFGREPVEFFGSREEYRSVQAAFFKSLLEGRPAETETKFRREDGLTFQGYLTAAALDNSQPWKGVVTTITDISARKRSEEARWRLEAAIEQAAETIMITDENGQIVYVNPAFERTTGHFRSEVLGQNPRLLKSGKHGQEFYESMWQTLASGKIWNGHFMNKRKDGTLYEEEATISPIRDTSGKIINYVAVKRDVTREVMLEKQLQHAQKMEAVGTLAGGVAHDFNNLLQVVGGYTDLILLGKSAEDPDYTKFLGIKKSVENGADLVKRILTFSRKVETTPRPVDLNHALKQALELLLRTIPKMIEVHLSLTDELKSIRADPGQLEQIILNLALNAKDAMPEGGELFFETQNVLLDETFCRTHFDSRPGDYVLLTVSDTGYGMGKDVTDRIFEPFFTTKKPGEGTGLGLSMVFGIVKTHGGQITCYSEPGVGTTFKLYFPALKTETLSDAKGTMEFPAGGQEGILLVDDEEVIRDLGREMLNLVGYRVITAGTGQEALRIYRERGNEVSIVILDLVMPEMGGLKCLVELLKIDPAARVLIASGYSAEGLAREALKSGARGFVGKPYNIKQLLKSVRDVLDAA
jgi:two-component system, cell cycle sensor histidine kinase and response regulator CckA